MNKIKLTKDECNTIRAISGANKRLFDLIIEAEKRRFKFYEKITKKYKIKDFKTLNIDYVKKELEVIR